MGEKLTKFKNLIKSIFTSITKHKVILINTVLIAVFGIIAIQLDYKNTFQDVSNKLTMAFLMGTLFSLPATYISEKFNSVKKYLIQVIASLIGAGGSYCILEFVKMDSYAQMYYMGIAFAVICLTITLFIPKENSKSYYANLVKNFLFCGLLCTIGIAGSCLLIYAFSSLIIEINNLDKLIESISIIWGTVVFINLFVFYLFEKREEPSGKAFRIIFLYILFPIYGILLLILYVYLLKALFTLSLPNGQINWFVSFATMFFLIFYFIFREFEENKLVKIFYKFGALVLVPLICVQFPAYFIRVSSYGFTGWRYSSLLYNIFIVVFVTFTFIKQGKFTKYAIPVLGGFVLFASVTPFNLIDVAYTSQYNKMVKILKQNGMFEDKQLTNYSADEINNTISDEEREELYSSFRYLRYKSEHKKPEWFNNNSFEELFNIETHIDENIIEYQMKENNNHVIDVRDFSTIENYYKSFWYGQEEAKPAFFPDTEIEITEELLALYRSEKEYLILKLDENTQAYIYEIDYKYNKEKEGFEYYRFRYYLMKK